MIDWAVRTASRRVRRIGRIEYERGEFLPNDRRFLAWFDAESPELVRRVTETAQLADVTVTEVFALEDDGDDPGDSDRA